MSDAGTGRPVWPGDPAGLTAADIDIEALAHVLANTCRWGGRTLRFYSLAQHALLASEAVEAIDGLPGEARRRLALRALIGVAPAAWLGDPHAPGPSSARAAERARRDAAAIDRAVREAAGLADDLAPDEADLLRFVARMVEAAERRDFGDAGMGHASGAAFPPLKRRIRPVDPGRAAKLWLARYRALAEPPPSGGSDAAAGAADHKENADVA